MRLGLPKDFGPGIGVSDVTQAATQVWVTDVRPVDQALAPIRSGCGPCISNTGWVGSGAELVGVDAAGNEEPPLTADGPDLALAVDAPGKLDTAGACCAARVWTTLSDSPTERCPS